MILSTTDPARMQLRHITPLFFALPLLGLCASSDENFESRTALEIEVRQTFTHSTSNVVGTVTHSRNNEKTEETIGFADRTFCTCTVTLLNDSDTPFEDVEADYRIFYTQKLTADYTGRYQLAGNFAIGTLAPGEKTTFESTKFLCGISYRSAPGIRWTGQPTSSEVNIEGVWILLRKPGQNGQWIEREIEHGDPPRRRDREDYQKVYK